MYLIRLPFLAPVHRFMLHLFTDLVMVSFILVGIEFGVVCFHKLLDKLSDSATFGILNKFSDDFPASCDGDTAAHALERVSGHVLLLTFIFLCLIAGIVLFVPKLTKQARVLFKVLVPLGQNTRLWVNVIVGHVLLWICQELAFYLFVRNLTPVQWTNAGTLTACYAFAWIVGFLSFLTPGGLSIWEGLLGLLLANYIPARKPC